MSESEVVPEEDSDAVDESDRLRGEVAVLREENERLREEYARAKQSQYRQSAATLAAIGGLSFGAGLVIGDAQTVLFALGGTGVFLGALIYFLTPEQFISASVGEAVYASLARNEAQMVDELGLAEERVYVPHGEIDPSGGTENVRLFIPNGTTYDIPEEAALNDFFVVTPDERQRGVAMRPTATKLYADFTRTRTGPPSDNPAELAIELGDSLVEQFELATSVRADVDTEAGQGTLRVTGSTLGQVDRFDHPVMSLFGTGIAQATGQAVRVKVTVTDDDTFLVSADWGQ